MFEKENIKPAQYLNQNIEVITSGFRAGKLDAAAIWEPTASRLVEEGLGNFEIAVQLSNPSTDPIIVPFTLSGSATEGLANTQPPGQYAPRPESRPLTKFERRGERLGHGVWDLLFTRVS